MIRNFFSRFTSIYQKKTIQIVNSNNRSQIHNSIKYKFSTKQISHLINPYTKQLVSDKQYASQSIVFQKISKLSRQQRQWRLLELDQRIRLIEKFVKSIFKDEDYIKNVIADSLGKSFKDTQQQLKELKQVYSSLIQSAIKSLRDKTIKSNENQQIKIIAEPVGLTLIFPHYSQPLFDSIINLIPCLISGSAALIKSADYNHFLGQYLEKKVLQETGYQIISDLFIAPDSLQSLASFRSLKKIIFSGSQSSAKHIFQILAENRFIDCNLFFGGQDAAYVDETADLQHAAQQIINSSFANNGQSYDCIERLYCNQKIYEQFLEILQQKVYNLKIGDPKQKGIDLGPLAIPQSALRIQQLVTQAVSYGASCHVGGLIHTQNYAIFFEPTLLTDVTSDMTIFQKQIFGPVLSCATVSSDQQFVKNVNDNKYGTGVRIFTQKRPKQQILKRYSQVIENIQVGKIVFNKGTLFTANGPIQGWKSSGKGKILSSMCFQEYTLPKVINIKKTI